jgi:hypothetical protein
MDALRSTTSSFKVPKDEVDKASLAWSVYNYADAGVARRNEGGGFEVGRLRIVMPVAIVAVVALAVVFAAGSYVGQNASGSVSDAAATVGVVVRGDWAVTVKNSDGTVARQEFFHNEFDGAYIVSNVFAHSLTPGRYRLEIDDSTLNSPCVDGFAPCFDFESDDPNAGTAANNFGNLTATATAANDLVITGSFIAQRNGEFDGVRMRSSSCSATIAPSACQPKGPYISWSDRKLSAPIAAVAGQQILITVTYTFSPAP